MAKLTLENLRAEYERLFDTMVVNSDRLAEADGIVGRIADHKTVYEDIMEATGVPWQIVGVFHSLEGSLDFSTHLHNGDSLKQRTVHVPKGHPKHGNPPFTFAESAIDALETDDLAHLDNWGLAETLFRLEKFNGLGYRRPSINIPTPYLWSYSNHYTKGKFKSDGEYSPSIVSKQCGGAVLIKRMIDKEIFSFEGMPRPVTVLVGGTPRPAVSAFVHKGNSWIAPRLLVPFISGLSVASVSDNAQTITLQFKTTGSNPQVLTRTFAGRKFHGNGHVDASELVRDFLKRKLQLNDKVVPNQLAIT